MGSGCRTTGHPIGGPREFLGYSNLVRTFVAYPVLTSYTGYRDLNLVVSLVATEEWHSSELQCFELFCWIVLGKR